MLLNRFIYISAYKLIERGSEQLRTREAEHLYRKHFAAIYSVCFLYMKNETDACDMVQETFLRLLQGHFTYEDDEKTKAWLIVTASNCCKSQLRKSWRKREIALARFFDVRCG